MKKRMTALCLLFVWLVALTSCARSGMEGNTPGAEAQESEADVRSLGGSASAEKVDLWDGGKATAEFYVDLFQNSLAEGENTLVSPLSVLCALAMTANGAEGETLHQMEEVLGLPAEELNPYLNAYLHSLPSQLAMANGIWFRESEEFTVSGAFLQTNTDYYGAEIRQASFDESTRQEINRWAEEKTGDMVKELVKELPADSVMCLVNALAFDGKWEEPFSKSQSTEGVFTTESGVEKVVTYLNCEEKRYLEDDMATGFVKFYDGGTYAFVGLLPNEGVSVAEYAASLTGTHLRELLASAKRTAVEVAIPKFEAVYEAELAEVLSAMGMKDAFDQMLADFSGVGRMEGGNLFVSSVKHKCFIDVNETGTSAGAAASVLLEPSSPPEPEETQRVCLDRPFVYLIVDCRYDVPTFMGTLMDPGTE